MSERDDITDICKAHNISTGKKLQLWNHITTANKLKQSSEPTPNAPVMIISTTESDAILAMDKKKETLESALNKLKESLEALEEKQKTVDKQIAESIEEIIAMAKQRKDVLIEQSSQWKKKTQKSIETQIEYVYDCMKQVEKNRQLAEQHLKQNCDYRQLKLRSEQIVELEKRCNEISIENLFAALATDIQYSYSRDSLVRLRTIVQSLGDIKGLELKSPKLVVCNIDVDGKASIEIGNDNNDWKTPLLVQCEYQPWPLSLVDEKTETVPNAENCPDEWKSLQLQQQQKPLMVEPSQKSLVFTCGLLSCDSSKFIFRCRFLHADDPWVHSPWMSFAMQGVPILYFFFFFQCL
ncbi:SMC domain protein [Reticulomyxa filosa]|uniref:SMC domain protein n=1 Tax=Reticulomyxa filosa TaxID=46433 RepID=X6NYY8_RETFI|nr:SMC domain protein [Reticulomyxa filosa]|eukprot:ETO31520.1 SMC domain protein [Reticulomyxa filosa]